MPLRPRASTVTAVIGGIALLAIITATAPAATTTRAAAPDFPARDALYHNFPEMVAEIQQAEVDHPAIVDVFSIGKSYEGRDIWAAKISDNVATDEPEPEVMFDALHHAREHMGVEQALALLADLTDGYGTDPEVTRLVDTREVWIVFAVNPDGFEFDLTGDPYRAWRKNRQPNAGTGAVGTDINRNYDYRWNCCGGSSGAKSAITYRGPRPFSAPETRAIRDFVRSRVIDGRQQIRAHITFHTNGELILYPYGYTYTDRPPDMTADDRAAFVSLARGMAARNGYRVMQSSDLYITDGDQIDWMYGRYRIFSFTYELYPPETASVWTDHYPPDERIAPETARNRAALLYLIDQAVCPWAPLGEVKARLNCGLLFDDLEISRGWQVDPDGTDTARRGTWERGDPRGTFSNGAKQLDRVTSGRYALVTGLAAGSTAMTNDLDGGMTTVRSAPIALPADLAELGPLSFRWSWAHGANASAGDALEAYVEGADGVRPLVFDRRGRQVDLDARWNVERVSLDAWAGQSIRIVFQARDMGRDSLIEAAIDDVRIERPVPGAPGPGPSPSPSPSESPGASPSVSPSASASTSP